MKPLGIFIPLFVFMFSPNLAFAVELPPCPACEEWNLPQAPFRIHGDTYYVGAKGLSAVLITGDEGHILIDGGLAESAPLIGANVEALGFRVEDIKFLLNSHAHFDHAGGIGELQRLSGAVVAVSPWSAEAMRAGQTPLGDPQFGIGIPMQPVTEIRIIGDGENVNLGDNILTAHFTAGHTPGGTSWAWRSCEDGRCGDIVYADSLTAVSADVFYFTRNSGYPNAVADFEKSFATLRTLPCDILISPHPGFTSLFAVQAEGGADAIPNAFIGTDACRNYAENAKENFDRRLARERDELGE